MTHHGQTDPYGNAPHHGGVLVNEGQALHEAVVGPDQVGVDPPVDDALLPNVVNHHAARLGHNVVLAVHVEEPVVAPNLPGELDLLVLDAAALELKVERWIVSIFGQCLVDTDSTSLKASLASSSAIPKDAQAQTVAVAFVDIYRSIKLWQTRLQINFGFLVQYQRQ